MQQAIKEDYNILVVLNRNYRDNMPFLVIYHILINSLWEIWVLRLYCMVSCSHISLS